MYTFFKICFLHSKLSKIRIPGFAGGLELGAGGRAAVVIFDSENTK